MILSSTNPPDEGSNTERAGYSRPSCACDGAALVTTSVLGLEEDRAVAAQPQATLIYTARACINETRATHWYTLAVSLAVAASLAVCFAASCATLLCCSRATPIRGRRRRSWRRFPVTVAHVCASCACVCLSFRRRAHLAQGWSQRVTCRRSRRLTIQLPVIRGFHTSHIDLMDGRMVDDRLRIVHTCGQTKKQPALLLRNCPYVCPEPVWATDLFAQEKGAQHGGDSPHRSHILHSIGMQKDARCDGSHHRVSSIG